MEATTLVRASLENLRTLESMKSFASILGLAAVALAATAALVPVASGHASATFPFDTEIAWVGGDSPSCPAGYSPTTECHPHSGGDVAVRGLGFVGETYLYPVETDPGPSCPGGYKVYGYTATLRIRNKGTIVASLGPVDRCLEGPPSDTVLTPTQPFTVTGGTGRFAGATGSGVLSRKNAHRLGDGHGAATDVWQVTLDAPQFTPDFTPPTITGAVDKVVRAPRYRVVHVSRRKTKRVRVKYLRVNYVAGAADDIDGNVPVQCKPKAGSRFRVGRTTTVHCSATDTSANTATARFAITVKVRKGR
jgi:hypothetical protein